MIPNLYLYVNTALLKYLFGNTADKEQRLFLSTFSAVKLRSELLWVHQNIGTITSSRNPTLDIRDIL